MQKKLHYLIGQLLEILLCDLVFQYVIFDEARWMLRSNPLFKFPLILEVMVHGLFEIILHGF